MKKTAIAILIAVLVVAIGAGLVFAGLSAVQFKFSKLDRTEYATNTHSVGPVKALDIQCHTADVELVAEGETDCKVVCFEHEHEKYAAEVRDGILYIRPETSGRRWSLFGFRFKSPKITVYLPAGTYESLKADLDTGDLVADRALGFDTVEVNMDTGDLTLQGVQARTVTAHTDTGDIHLSDMAPETATVSVNTGKIKLDNVVCSGDLRCESSTGDIRLTDVDGANLYLSASTGDILGTIRTPKVFDATTSTGKVDVPAEQSGASGRCQARTGTGDIRLSISGK